MHDAWLWAPAPAGSVRRSVAVCFFIAVGDARRAARITITVVTGEQHETPRLERGVRSARFHRRAAVMFDRRTAQGLAERLRMRSLRADRVMDCGGGAAVRR